MKKLLVMLLICAAITFSGCAGGLLQTGPERGRRLTQIGNLQMRALVDDGDYLLMLDHTTNMSFYHIESGM